MVRKTPVGGDLKQYGHWNPVRGAPVRGYTAHWTPVRGFAPVRGGARLLHAGPAPYPAHGRAQRRWELLFGSKAHPATAAELRLFRDRALVA